MTTDRTSKGTFYLENLLRAQLDHPLFNADIDFVYKNKNRQCTIRAVTSDKNIKEVFVITIDTRQLHSEKVMGELKEFKRQIMGFWIQRHRMIQKLLGNTQKLCEFYPEFFEQQDGSTTCKAGVSLTKHHECTREFSKECLQAQYLRDRGDVYIMKGQSCSFQEKKSQMVGAILKDIVS